MFDMMMQHYMDMGDNRAVFEHMQKAGNRDPPTSLDIFASMASPECMHNIAILQIISVF